MSKTIFLLWCRECNPEITPDNPIPFESASARGIWATAHTKGTTHDRWLVIDLPYKED